jgi:hypothetical protein
MTALASLPPQSFFGSRFLTPFLSTLAVGQLVAGLWLGGVSKWSYF